MWKRPPPIPLAIKGCSCAEPRVGRGIPPLTGGAVPVMGITAHSAVYCFGLNAPPGAKVRIMCLSSKNLGPLNWRPYFFSGCNH